MTRKNQIQSRSKSSKVKLWLLVAAGFLTVSLANAGVIEIDPAPVDPESDPKEFVIAVDGKLTFTAVPDADNNPGASEVEMDVSCDESPSYEGNGTDTVVATFGPLTEGKKCTVTVTLTHTKPDPNGGPDDGIDCTKDKEYTFIVYVPKVETETLATSPSDKTRKKIGVGEEVKITISADFSLGQINWSVANNDGQVNQGPSSDIATYTAPDTKADAIVQAEIKNQKLPIEFEVIEPEGVYMEIKAGSKFSAPSPIRVQYVTYFYLTPANVNFENLEVYEDTCDSVTEGYYDHSNYNDKEHEPSFEPVGMEKHVANKGTKALAIDTIYFAGAHTPYSAGKFTYPIPWNYKINQTDKKFSTNDGVAEMTEEEEGVKLTASKCGTSHYATNP